MISVFAILILSFLTLLFILFVLTKDDFVFIRKNITTEQVFNITFLVGIVALFGARLAFVLFHFGPLYYNPLVFLLFPYFPGLSLVGAVLGGLMCVLLYSKVHKIPMSHFLDFLAVATSGSIVVGFLTEYVFIRHFTVTNMLLGAIIFALLAIMLWKCIQINILKEGTVAFLFLASFAFIFLADSAIKTRTPLFLIQKESIIFCIIFIFSMAIVIKNEKRFTARKKWKSIR